MAPEPDVEIVAKDGTVYTFHPACALFPLMTDAELDQLAAGIKANKGLLVPITRFQGPGTEHRGTIIEGRNRLLACERAGVTPVIVDRDDIADPVSFVINANILRRHLTTEQKRDLVIKLLKLDPAKSDRQVAAMTGVSHPTVSSVRKKQEAVGKIYQQEKVRTKDNKVRPRKVKTPLQQLEAQLTKAANERKLKAIIAEKDERIRELEALVAEKDELINKRIAEKDELIRELKEEVTSLRSGSPTAVEASQT